MKDPREAQLYLAQYFSYADAGDYLGALEALQKGTVHHRDVSTFYQLIEFLKGQLPQQAGQINRFLQKYPPIPQDGKMRQVYDLAHYESEVEGTAPVEPKGEIKNWIMQDYEKITGLCRQHNSMVMLQDYPANNDKTIEQLNELLHQAAKGNDVHYVDYSTLFGQIKDKRPFFAHGGMDQHPNEFGYQLMAQVLYQYITYKGLIPAIAKEGIERDYSE
jgi:hypothetical protein